MSAVLEVRQLCKSTLRLAGQPGKWTLALPAAVVRAAVSTCCAVGLAPPVEPGVLEFAILYWYAAPCTKAEAELGYRTRTVDEILGPTVEWLREAGHIRKLSAPSRMC